MGSIRALRSRRDVGTVAGCLESREVRLRGFCEHGRHRGHERARSKVAALAVRVKDAPAIASSVRSRHDLAAGQVLVLVMAEMLLGQSTRLVRAVRRSRGPDHLERHHAQQEDEHPTTHIFLYYTSASLQAMDSAVRLEGHPSVVNDGDHHEGGCKHLFREDSWRLLARSQPPSTLFRVQSTQWQRIGICPRHDRSVMSSVISPHSMARASLQSPRVLKARP